MTTDECLACRKVISVCRDGTLRVHGKPNNRCRGSASFGAAAQAAMVRERELDRAIDNEIKALQQ